MHIKLYEIYAILCRRLEHLQILVLALLGYVCFGILKLIPTDTKRRPHFIPGPRGK